MNLHCPSCGRQVPVTPQGSWGRHRVGPGKRASACPMSGQAAPAPKPKKGGSIRRRRVVKSRTPHKRAPRAPRVCPEHGATLVAGKTQYGTRWACPEFGCTVAQWNGSTSTPADLPTRAARMRAHAVFDQLWSPGIRGDRKRMYAALAAFMGLPIERTHIGMFDAAQCERVIEFCRTQTGENYDEA